MWVFFFCFFFLDNFTQKILKDDLRARVKEKSWIVVNK